MNAHVSYRRNVAKIERLAKEVLVQCGNYRRNAPTSDERLRFWLIRMQALTLLSVAELACRRYERERKREEA